MTYPTYYERGQMIAQAIAAGHGLYVETDPGTSFYEPAELQELWDDLAPGEPLRIEPCAVCKSGAPVHIYVVSTREECAA